MEGIYLCLDVGGTEIKAAPIEKGGNLLRPLCHFPAKAKEPKSQLLAHFTEILEAVGVAGREVAGLRLAFPGPFDYERGICLLSGLDKYDALYQVNLREELAGRTKVVPEEIRFANDASAFALGEMRFGQAVNALRALCICIGTGCGSAFGLDGALAPTGTPGVPDSGHLYDTPYLDRCIDDYLSRRGLMSLTLERLGEALDGKSLAQRVAQGDERARQCFLAFGERLAEALLPFFDAFQPDVLCLGGQITGSAPLFLVPLEAACRVREIRLCITKDTSVSTLRGLTVL